MKKVFHPLLLRISILLLLTVIWVSPTGAQDVAPPAIPVESTFDANLGGWTGHPSEVSWVSTGGNPDGFARWQDAVSASPPLTAPNEFLGNWSSLDGVGFISYDQKIFSTGSFTSRGSFKVGISGPGGSATWYGPQAPNSCPGQPGCGWTTYFVPIIESEWTLTSGSWSALLSEVNGLVIHPELYSNILGTETQGIDNVRLAIAAPTQNIIDATYGMGAGSFELGAFVNGGGLPPTASGYMGVASGDSTTITGWTVGGPGDGVDWLTAYNFAADSGYHAVDLKHLYNSSMATVIPTVAGKVYELSFSAAAVWQDSNTGVVSAGSLVDQPFAAVLSSHWSTQTYTPFRFLFTATESTTTIEFTATGPEHDRHYGPVIDSVSVRDVDLFGQTLKISPSYEFSLEQGTSKTDSIQMFNANDASRSATLELITPHPDLAITLQNPEVTIAPGATELLTLQLDAESTAVGVYDGILLEVVPDEGSHLYANITVYVTEPGVADLPDLTISTDDITLGSGSSGEQILTATICNRGSSPASNVPVQFYELDTWLGETVIEQVLANECQSTAILVSLDTLDDHLTRAVIDPSETIPELDESNNEATRIVQPGGPSGPTEGKILVRGDLPLRVCPNSFFTLTGQAVYDITVGGVRDTSYVVKGGAVQITTGWSTLYGDLHTDVNGNFTRFLLAPASPGSYSVSMTVSDNTFSGTGNFFFEVEEEEDCETGEPGPFVPAPVPDVGPPDIWKLIDALIGLWEWVCSGGNCQSVSVPEQDVFVYSEHIAFSNDQPDPNDEITIRAEIQYFATRTDLPSGAVQVNFNVTSPGSPTTSLPSWDIDGIPAGRSRGAFINWKPLTDGIHIIEAAAVPIELNENTLNNAATRAIIVGQYTSGQGVISGQIRDSSSGVANVPIQVSDESGIIGSTVTNDTGFYLIENVPVGDFQVQVIVPPGYLPNAEVKAANVADQSVSTVDFVLTRTDMLLSISAIGTDIELTWTPALATSGYEIHRSTTPFFTPISSTLLITLPATTGVYTDTGIAGDPATSYFYQVGAVDGSGQVSNSNEVGEIDYALNNASGKYSMLTIPLTATTIIDAASLAEAIGDVTALLKWNPTSQTFRFFVPPSFGDNFSLVPGEAVFVQASSSGPSVVTVVGEVMAVQHSLTPGGFNFISLPLQRADLTQASDVAADIGGVTTMLSWNETTQAFRFFVPPSFGDNFPITIGQPFIVDLAENSPTEWP